MNEKFVLLFDDGFCGKLNNLKQYSIHNNLESIKNYLKIFFDKIEIIESDLYNEWYIDCYIQCELYTGTIYQAWEV